MNDKVSTRTLPLRRWLAIGFIAILISFILPLALTYGLLFQTGAKKHGSGLTWAKEQAETNLDRWNDPAWQAETIANLDDRDADAIYRIDGVDVFQTPGDPFAGVGDDGLQSIRLQSTENGLAYEAIFSMDADEGPPKLLEYVLPISLVFMIASISAAALFLRRAVLEPLAATSTAAGQVAVGELDIALPGSRVREVSEVNAAIVGMSTALKQSLAQQAKLEEERRLFIGAVAHDLRTPLFSLRGSLEGLATGIANTPEKQEQYLSVAREKADNLERLISDLFDFTRLEFLEQTPHREEVDLNAILQRSIDGIASQAEAKQIKLVHESASEPLLVDADAHMLSRAIENVLDNALRHTPEGGNITIQSGTRESEVWFSIADTGPGVADADLPNIFTPLYRSDASRNSRTGGAGLGLSIARNMLRAHGGDLTARNSEAGGAVFEGTNI